MENTEKNSKSAERLTMPKTQRLKINDETTVYHVMSMTALDSFPVACKYSVLSEIIDIFTQACKVCIHDEDVAETAFEYSFETPKGFRSGFGKPCAQPAVGHLETS